jgi:tRNA nucleotidyltransferase (CCA-adding enzyme)
MVQVQVDAQQIVRSRLPGRVLAREIMSSPPITIGPDASVVELAALLSKHHISGAPVVDEQGRLLGVATEADVLERPGDRVCEVMTTSVATVSEDTPVEDVAECFARHRVKRAPVVRDGRPVGVVSRADIVRAIGRVASFR